MTTKEKLYKACFDFAAQRIQALNDAQKELSEDAGSEAKSSAGDKHETGRAMMQLEQEKNAEQLTKANELLIAMEKIDPSIASDKVALGSLVITNRGQFYISISAGKISIDGKDYFAVSPQAPIAARLIGLQAKQTFQFNGVEYLVEAVK
ncbi:MAG: 3-oxoacyl-ACP synthase [Bacteroidetes bacterium]|nr:3-oxoacyl-ACP synthase [Bacteroidota bacterium]